MFLVLVILTVYEIKSIIISNPKNNCFFLSWTALEIPRISRVKNRQWKRRDNSTFDKTRVETNWYLRKEK